MITRQNMFRILVFFLSFNFCLNIPQSLANKSNSENLFSSAFVENKGQLNDLSSQPRTDILFNANYKNGIGVFLRKQGWSYVFSKTNEVENNLEQGKEKYKSTDNALSEIKLHRVDIDFIKPNNNFVVVPSRQKTGNTNYFANGNTEGINGVRSFETVTYKNIYNNINVVYDGSSDMPKYEFVIEPGGNVSDIKLEYKGADGIEISSKGHLIIKTSIGDAEDRMPKVYQNINGKIIDIAARYIIIKNNEGGEAQQKLVTGFEILQSYNHNFSLIIDPWVTYYGGSGFGVMGFDYGVAVCTDNLGNAYFAGSTASTSFPVTSGAFQTFTNGWFESFLVKFDGTGNRQWATYFGGSGANLAYDVVADGNNDPIIVGVTNANNLPVTIGAFQTARKGGADIFAAKFNTAGGLSWATYLGGSQSDGTSSGMGIGDGMVSVDTDGANDIIISSVTESTNFPVTGSAYQTSFALGDTKNACITKFTSAGLMSWSTFFGGSAEDYSTCIAVGPGNTIYIVGNSNSTDLPASVGVFQSVYSGSGLDEPFIAKFSGSGNFSWTTHYSGTGGSSGYITTASSIDADAAGNVVINGSTNDATFPTTPGVYQPSLNTSSYDIFLAKINNSGQQVWGGLFGGSDIEEATGIAVDPYNNIVVGGDTYSSDMPATSCGFQTAAQVDENNFIARFDSDCKLMCSGYVGGDGHDETSGSNSTAASRSSIFLTTNVYSNYPTTPGSFQTAFSGSGPDAAFSSLCINTCGLSDIVLDFSANQTSICTNGSVDFSGLLLSCDSLNTEWQWTFTGAVTATSSLRNPNGIFYNTGGNYSVKLKVITPCGADSVTKNTYINVNNLSSTNSVTNVTCFGLNNGIASVTGNAGAFPYSYLWNTGNTASSVSGLMPANYTCTITDMAGCTSTQTVSVTQPLALTSGINLLANPLCNGDANGSATAAGNNGTAPFTYSWNNGQTNQVGSNLSAGLYTCTVTDTKGCISTSTVLITDPAVLTSSLVSTSSVSCYGGNNGVATFSVNGGTGPYNYNWSASGGNQNSASSLSAGTYTLLVRDSHNCINTQTISITQALPIVILGSVKEDTCGRGTGSVNTIVNGGTVGYSYSWSNAFTTSGVSNLSNGNYLLTVTDLNGCTQTSIFNVGILSGPIADAGQNMSIHQGQTISLNGSGGGVYNWLPSDGVSCNTCSSPIVSPTQSTLYTLIVTDVNGCTDLDTVRIDIDVLCGDVKVPNAFSPNGDGQNDVLEIYSSEDCVKKFQFSVFNRWGEKVFETNNLSDTWNGEFRNKLMGTDVFTYSLFIFSIDDEVIQKSGNISLIR